MDKIIISLYAPANSGKTKTIRSLFLKLGGNKNVLAGTDNFVSSLVFGQKEIAFVSQGDPNSNQLADLEKAAQGNPNIIITAARTKGGTVDNVYDVANRFGYDVVWFSPFYFNDADYGTDKLFQSFADRNADNIIDYIISKL